MTFRGSILFFALSFARLPVMAQCPSGPEKPHADTICGLSIGMKPEEVLAIMKRRPDAGKEEGEDKKYTGTYPQKQAQIEADIQKLPAEKP